MVATEPPAATPPIPVRKPEQTLPDTGPAAVPPLPSAKPVPPKVPYHELWRPDQLTPVSQDFADKIDEAEQSHGRWDLESTSSTAVGRYQLLSGGLQDIGLVDSNGRWHGYPYPDREEFLDSPELQNLAFAAYLKTMLDYLEANNSIDFVGREIDGTAGAFEVTEAGLVAAAHREGQGRVAQYFEHLAAQEWVSDPETFPLDPIPGDRKKKDAFEQIEECLREFEHIPLYRQPDASPLNEAEIFQ